MRAPTSTNGAQTLSIKAGTAKRFSVSREIAGLSSGTRPHATPSGNRWGPLWWRSASRSATSGWRAFVLRGCQPRGTGGSRAR